jgi:hypothetical protein
MMRPLSLYSCFLRGLLLAACLCAVASHLSAQTMPSLREGSFEIGVLAGDTIGGLVPADIALSNFNNFRVKSPGAGVFGMNIAIAGSSKLLFYGQVSGFKGEHEPRGLPEGYSATTNLFNLVYEGGFERILPIHSRSVALYALGAGATIQKRVDVIVNYADQNAAPAPTDVLGAATRVRLKNAVFAPVVGVGLRYYAGRLFGFRFESKAYFPTGDVPRPTGVACAGVFVDLPKRVQ